MYNSTSTHAETSECIIILDQTFCPRREKLNFLNELEALPARLFVLIAAGVKDQELRSLNLATQLDLKKYHVSLIMKKKDKKCIVKL